MNQEELNRVLDEHAKWLRTYGEKGVRAVLTGADLTDAVLTDAVLTRAVLTCAVLTGADLTRAVLTGAVLTGAVLTGAVLPAYGIPEQGDLTAWKAVRGGIARVRIPANAKRTGSLVGRKCRAEYVITEYILLANGSEPTEAKGQRGNVMYRVGEATYPDSYNDDPRVECTNGIHFFLTRREAEEWQTP